MKPAITPYDRNSRLGLKMLTVNPCNQFIIEALLRWKVNTEKKGLNQFYTYNLSIEAVRKYPMPILCYEQMKNLEGFGRFFCNSVANLVRKHYRRGRLPTQEQKDEDDRQHEEYLSRQMRKFKKSQKKNGLVKQQQNGNSAQMDNQTDNYSQFNDNFSSQFAEDELDQVREDDEDSNSDYSEASQAQSVKSYKPKPGCEVHNILKAISSVASTKVAKTNISRGEINSQLYSWKMDKIRSWDKTTKHLQKSGYIKIDPKDPDSITLTTKAKDYLEQFQQTVKTPSQAQPNRIIIFHKQNLNLNPNNKPINPSQLSILLNSKGSLKCEDQLKSMLAKLDGRRVGDGEFELGSCLWMLDGKVLDWVVFRFKVQGFDEEEYLANCLRARNSLCSNVIILLEFSEAKGKKGNKVSPELAQLIAKSRAAGFKVYLLAGTAETAKFLHSATESILKTLSDPSPHPDLQSLGSLPIFNEQNKKPLPFTIKNLTKKLLKCIPKISRDTVQLITERLPSFCIAATYLRRLRDRGERLAFMGWLLRDVEVRAGVLGFYDDLLFRVDYGCGEGEDIQ